MDFLFLLLLFKIEHKVVRETHWDLAGEELEKVMSRYDFMYTLVHICEIFKEYLVRCLPHQCENLTLIAVQHAHMFVRPGLCSQF